MDDDLRGQAAGRADDGIPEAGRPLADRGELDDVATGPLDLGEQESPLGAWLMSRMDSEVAIRIGDLAVTSWDYSGRM